MKFIKYFLLTVLGIVALILLVAAFVSKDFHAGSEITINKPKAQVFDYVKLIKNQGNYDNWSRQDPNIQRNYEGTDGTPGFIYTWKSKKVGDGKQVITKVDSSNGRIDMDLFFNGTGDANKSFMQVNEIDPQTSKVIWEIDGKMPYPFNVMGLFFDMNKDFDAGLSNLKEILEK
ncbi:SRPBCC family protein [Sphingobacterium cellulitidis]|uniref:SRPBCC family protein n=1 Tax=Sphingobacterium cellulitidis TaxID=1768011 RepID=UPI003C7CB09C